MAKFIYSLYAFEKIEWLSCERNCLNKAERTRIKDQGLKSIWKKFRVSNYSIQMKNNNLKASPFTAHHFNQGIRMHYIVWQLQCIILCF